MTQNESEELFNVILEIKRCIAAFWNETQTNLEVESYDKDEIKLLDIETGNRFMLKIEKLN